MKTYVGDKVIYDNFLMGTAEHPANPGSTYVVFTDKDNEETHMFGLDESQLEGFVEMLNTARGKKNIIIAGANQMPGGPNGLS